MAESIEQQLEKAKALNKKLATALLKCLKPIKTAWIDNHSAGMMPGAGYHHRVYNELPFNWRQRNEFMEWCDETTELIKEVQRG